MSLIDFLIVGLATWRLASLLVNEDGPFDVFEHIRNVVVGEGEVKGLGTLFSCVWCMSIWTGAICYALWTVWEVPIIILALSALAIAVGEYIASLNSNQTEPP